MTKITKKTFIKELLKEIPEFKQIHEDNKDYHDIGIHLIFGDFRRFVEECVDNNDQEILKRVNNFVIRCFKENEDQVYNALFVSFFEHLSKNSLNYFYKVLPDRITLEIKNFLKAWDEFIANKDNQ